MVGWGAQIERSGKVGVAVCQRHLSKRRMAVTTREDVSSTNLRTAKYLK